MTTGDSHKSSKRPRKSRGPGSEALWSGAAMVGLLLIGLLLGGVGGVYLDRQGWLGSAPVPAQVAEAAADPVTPAPPPAEPRVLSAAPVIDREALEAEYHASQQQRAQRQETLPDLQAALPPNAAPPVQGAGQGELPRWQRHAVAVADPDGRPMIAIVLDDVGVNRRGARRAIELPAPLTIAFMTYATGLPEMTAAARKAGHELMLHVPMQPMSDAMDPGSNVLSEHLPPAELVQRLAWGLDRFDGYVGINNHMGSRFTASREGMSLVMDSLKARGLLFLDSLTAGNSVAGDMAALRGVPYAVRDVFLDNEPEDPASIHRQLALLEQTARERGYAIGIGHPHDGTVDALAQWIPEMRKRGFALVPVSAIVRHRQHLAARPPADG